jgi:parvulin-like peptidyl-prolyl isomerase
VARRIALPRLTRRQRMAKWQRERRQQAIYLGAFSTILFFALGLVGWAAAGRYYEDNLKPAAVIDGRHIPLRDFNRQLLFEKTRFFVEAGVPAEAEDDPQLTSQVASLREGALDVVVMREVLGTIAREERALPSREDTAARVERDFGQLHVRHILIPIDSTVADKQKAEADAKAKAEQIAGQLRAAPTDQQEQLWKDLAAKESSDPGSKDNGGDLGWVSAQSGFIKEFETAMYSLSDGQVSDPVKSDFGYHVIQRMETRAAADTQLYSRLRSAGIGEPDLHVIAEGSLLRELYEKRAREAEIESPQEQVHIAQIIVRLPPPTDFEPYAAALKRISDVTKGLEQGTDFGELAKLHSDDVDTRDKGGDAGWVTRAMLQVLQVQSGDKNIVSDVFGRQKGERTDQHSLAGGDVVIYKILDKDPARAVTDEQKTKIQDAAFTNWLAEQETRLAVQRLIPGLEF